MTDNCSKQCVKAQTEADVESSTLEPLVRWAVVAPNQEPTTHGNGGSNHHAHRPKSVSQIQLQKPPGEPVFIGVKRMSTKKRKAPNGFPDDHPDTPRWQTPWPLPLLVIGRRRVTGSVRHISMWPNVQDNRAHGPTKLRLEQPINVGEANDAEEPKGQCPPVHLLVSWCLLVCRPLPPFQSRLSCDARPNVTA